MLKFYNIAVIPCSLRTKIFSWAIISCTYLWRKAADGTVPATVIYIFAQAPCFTELVGIAKVAHQDMEG